MKDSRRYILGVIFSAGLAVITCMPGTGGFVWATPVSQAEKEQAEAAARQEQAQAKARELESQKQTADGKVQGLGQELSQLLTETDILAGDMEEMRKRIGEAEAEYKTADESRQRQYRILKARIQYVYEEGNISYLDILLKTRNMGDVVRQTEYFNQLYEYDKKLIADYEKLRQEAADRKELLEEKQSELKVMSQEYGLRRKQLEAVIEEKKKESANFEKQLAAAEAEAEKAAQEVRAKTEEIRILKENAAKEAERQKVIGPVPKASGTGFGSEVANYALQFVGNPYVWGGTSLTDGTDCSGFTQSVYRHFGVAIPRTSGEQAHFGQEIAYEDMEPGDLVCYVGHVAMYIGDGRIVHASSQKSGIKVGDDPAYRTIVSIRRPW